MMPESYVPGITGWIGAVFPRTGGAKDSDHRDANRRRKVHRTAVITNKERAAFELRSYLPYTRLAREVGDCSHWYIQAFQQLFIKRCIIRPADQYDLCA